MAIYRSLDLSSVILNGITIEGWSEDEDALTMPDSIELAVIKKGADGLMVAGRTAEKGGEVTLKLLANSSTVQALQAIVLAEKNGAAVNFSGVITYNDGSIATLDKGVLKNAPNGYTLGKGAPGTMSYVFEFQVIDFETITGSFESP